MVNTRGKSQCKPPSFLTCLGWLHESHCYGKSSSGGSAVSDRSITISQSAKSANYVCSTKITSIKVLNHVYNKEFRQGWKKSKFSEWPVELFNIQWVLQGGKSKNFLKKKFFRSIAHQCDSKKSNTLYFIFKKTNDLEKLKFLVVFCFVHHHFIIFLNYYLSKIFKILSCFQFSQPKLGQFNLFFCKKQKIFKIAKNLLIFTCLEQPHIAIFCLSLQQGVTS